MPGTVSQTSLALSVDCKRLCSVSGEFKKPGEIKVWDLESGKETLTLRGHTAGVSSLALSVDGKRLFSGSGDKTIKVWDVETELAAARRQHEGAKAKAEKR